MDCWTMSSLFKYIIIRSVNEHKHRVDVKDMYTFSSFLWLSVGNTLRLSPIVWSKENKGSLQVLQQAIDPLAFCFKLRSSVLLPFLFWRRKNEKKTTDRRFFVFVLLLLLLLFFSSLLISFHVHQTLFQTRLVSKKIMRKHVTKYSNQKAYALKLIPGV